MNFANNFTQPEETLRFGRGGVDGPSGQKSAGSGKRGEPQLLGVLLMESVLVNCGFQLAESFVVVLASIQEAQIETSGAEVIVFSLLIL